MSELDEIKKMTMKLSSATDAFAEKCDKTVQHIAHHAKLLNENANQLNSTAHHATTQALEQFEEQAGHALKNGLNAPIKDFDKSLQKSAYAVEVTASKIEKHLIMLQKIHIVNYWMAIVGIFLACLAAIGLSTYLVSKNMQELKRADLTSRINAATTKGNLVDCEGDGVCAKYKGQLIRLDK